MADESGEKAGRGFAPGSIEARLAGQWGPDNPPPLSPGRPKGKLSMTTLLREMLKLNPKDLDQFMKTPLPEHLKKQSIPATIQGRLIVKAMMGDLAAYDRIMDRTEGKVKEVIRVEREDEVNLADLPPALRAEVLREMLEDAKEQNEAEAEAAPETEDEPAKEGKKD